MCRNSGAGTRTKMMEPLVWLNRVGFSHVSYECRLIFFSRAPRMRSHGLVGAVAVDVNDMRELISIEPAEARRSTENSPVARRGQTSSVEHVLVQTKILDWSAY